MCLRPLATLTALLGMTPFLAVQAQQPVTHSFLATGAETKIVDSSGKTIWSLPGRES